MPDMSVAPTPHPRSTVPGVPAFTPPRRASASAASAPTGRTSTGRRLSDWFRSLSSSSSTVSTTSTSSTTQVLCRTRPHTLPPKPKAEDAKHLAEYAKMMKAAQARDAAARAKAAKLRLAREKEAIAALNTWTSQILPNWDKVRYAKKTTDLWFKGVPPRLRGTVWARAVGNPLHVSPDVYELCKRRAADALTSHRMQRAALDAALVEAVAKRTRAPSLSSGESSAATLSGHGETAPPQLPMVFQGRKDTLDLIANDISRTFPALGVFQQPNGPLAEPLASVLEAFAVYRADMGYVQGMSYLAAMLLLNMDDYSAFATLCTMFRHRSGVLPVFYRLDLPLVAKYFSVFSTLLAQVSPGLAAHFDRIGLRPEFFLYEWFLSLFSKPLPLDMAARVWDLYFLDGDAALFRIAVALLRFHERQLVGLAFDECISDVLRLPGRIKPGPAGRVGEVDADVAFWDCVRDSVALDRDAYRALCRGAGLVPPE
ncbi:hypothetical protein GGF31_008453 [Allomyces arbusculus]|nr:hypothetical protein GGF31_008453 [Allomyces arbusculus]